MAMIDALFGDSNYVAAKKMLDVNVLRHEAIASNIANVETPNYKRLDVAPSFESQLSQAVARLAQHFDFGVVLQHAAKASPHQGVVVDQQYGNR